VLCENNSYCIHSGKCTTYSVQHSKAKQCRASIHSHSINMMPPPWLKPYPTHPNQKLVSPLIPPLVCNSNPAHVPILTDPCPVYLHPPPLPSPTLSAIPPPPSHPSWVKQHHHQQTAHAYAALNLVVLAHAAQAGPGAPSHLTKPPWAKSQGSASPPGKGQRRAKKEFLLLYLGFRFFLIGDLALLLERTLKTTCSPQPFYPRFPSASPLPALIAVNEFMTCLTD
jgi:hypothetical protein